MRRLTAVCVALAALLAGCGGDGGGGASDGPATAAAWQEEYGPVLAAVDTALDRAQAATKNGEPVAIRTNCEGLRDAVAEAKETPAVPDADADRLLRTSLDGLSKGASDCLRSISQGDTPLLERSISEVREARLQFDTAKAKITS